jgi:hypothetical protein
MCYKQSTFMIRTHFYLTEEQARAIEIKSLRENRPKAQVMRDVVDRGLQTDAPSPRKSAGQGLLELAELGKRLGITGPTDLSTNHDEYLYGDKE